MKSLVLCFLLFLACVSPSIAQQRLAGQVVDVLDGRTLVVKNQGRDFKFRVEYIEVPETDQPLNAIVIDHLKLLAGGKTVDMAVHTLGDIVTGAATINGNDLAMQMLRDGAAWYDVPNGADQDDQSRSSYQQAQDLAKSEKRGVWGIQGMKTAWEFRAEKVRLERETQDKQNEEQLAAAKERRNASRKLFPTEPVPPQLPSSMPGVKFISRDVTEAAGSAVVAVGYLDPEKKTIVKGVKKAAAGDVVCAGFDAPAGFTFEMGAISPTCPSIGYGDNANVIVSAEELSRRIKAGIRANVVPGLVNAYRMYKVSGNYEEFFVRAGAAIEVARQYQGRSNDQEINSALSTTTEALRDAIYVKKARSGHYGIVLDGQMLLNLNSKYDLNDVSEYLLDDEIIGVGIQALNRLGRLVGSPMKN